MGEEFRKVKVVIYSIQVLGRGDPSLQALSLQVT